jgi:glucokinase
MGEYYLAVDIGATNTRIALGTRNGILSKKTYRTPRTGGPNVIAEKIYEEATREYDGLLASVKRIGVATIGPVNIREGSVQNTPNLPIHSFPLKKPLEKLFGRKTIVLNDAVAGAYGEWIYGGGRGYKNLVYVTLSTGVGGGAIVNGHLLIGKMGNAHEIGHIVVNYDDNIPCGCGGHGHWEAYAGGANIPRTAMIIAEKHRGEYDTRAYYEALQGRLTPPLLFQRYREGDDYAKLLVGIIIEATIAGLASTINLYDPEIVLIGGSIYLNNRDILLEPIRKGVRKPYFKAQNQRNEASC